MPRTAHVLPAVGAALLALADAGAPAVATGAGGPFWGLV
jgi:hypothetical protein